MTAIRRQAARTSGRPGAGLPARGARAAPCALAAASLVAAALALVPPAARADSVALSWTAPGDDGMVGRSTSYEIRYSETPVSADTAGWWASAAPVASLPAPLAAGARESFIVVGLRSGATYYFVLRSADEVPNVSAFSNVCVKQTSPSVALATPGQFRAQLVPGGVLASWDPVQPGGELGYRLYRIDAADTSTGPLATLPLTTTEWTDTTVRPHTAYQYRVTTYNDSAESAPATLAISTPDDLTQPVSAELHGYPNPARDHVTFRFDVAASSNDRPTRVTIFDLTGHKICEIVNRVLPPGGTALAWSCRTDRGDRVAPGLYNIVLDGPSGRSVTRLAILP